MFEKFEGFLFGRFFAWAVLDVMRPTRLADGVWTLSCRFVQESV